MLYIDSGQALARALNIPLQPALEALLLKRLEQLGGEIAGNACFIIVQPGDRPSWVEECLGWSPLANVATGSRWGDEDYFPGFDTLEDHGFCFELTFEFTSDFTYAVFVENVPRTNREFLAFCTEQASQHA